MKTILLTRNKSTIVSPEDYDYLSKFKWYYQTNGSGGYAARCVQEGKHKRTVLMSRVINNTPKGFETDHINQNKLDNRRGNLRTVTHSENQHNTVAYSNSRSGLKGVGWHKATKKWAAIITEGGQSLHLGLFTNKKIASLAYQHAAKELYGI